MSVEPTPEEADAERPRLAEIRALCLRACELEAAAGLEPADSESGFLLEMADLLERLLDQRAACISLLLDATIREIERRRAAVTALRHLRRRFTNTIVDGQIPGAPGAAWVMDVDGKSVWVPEFIDAAIAAAEENG